jgi:predicted Zn-dependent protease
MKLTRHAFALFALVFLLQGLSGCGGGGGMSVVGPPTPTTTFTPNFISSLTSLNHWSALPIKVFFNLPPNWTTFYAADLPTNAALSWNQPGEQAFFVVVSSASQADVVVSFVNNPDPSWGVGAVGITNSQFDASTGLLTPGSVSVTAAVHDQRGQLLTSEEMTTTIAHELGHALGINGHSPNPSDLMYPIQQPGISTPQTRDINTAMTAYPAYFGTKSLPLSATRALGPHKMVNVSMP